MLGLRDLQVLLVPQVPLEVWDPPVYLVAKVTPGLMGRQEPQVRLEQQDRLVHRVQRERLELLASTVLPEHLVLLEQLDLLDQQVRPVQVVREVLLEHRVYLELLDLLVYQEHQDH